MRGASIEQKAGRGLKEMPLLSPKDKRTDRRRPNEIGETNSGIDRPRRGVA
jgi:hypothetical protein